MKPLLLLLVTFSAFAQDNSIVRCRLRAMSHPVWVAGPSVLEQRAKDEQGRREAIEAKVAALVYDPRYQQVRGNIDSLAAALAVNRAVAVTNRAPELRRTISQQQRGLAYLKEQAATMESGRQPAPIKP